MKKNIYCEFSGTCNYEGLLFLYSKYFDNDKIDILINEEYKNKSSFWTICINAPSYRGEKVQENIIINCYRKLDHLKTTHYQVENYINDEFKLTLYKSR